MDGYTHLALFAQHQAIGWVPTEFFDFFFRAVRGWAMFVPATTTIREQHSGASSCSNIKMFSTRESFSFIPTNKQPQIHFSPPKTSTTHVPKCPGWNQSPGLRVLSTVQRGPTGVPVRKRMHKFSSMQQKGTCVDRGAVFQIVIAVTM
jgi:hypothetical protein